MQKPRFSRKDYKDFCQICSMSEYKIQNLLNLALKQFYPEDQCIIDDDGSYLVAWGEIPIALVAHMDTVHISPPERFFHDQEAGVVWSPDGLGADDRAGIYAILRILQDGYRPTVIFTNEEEVGGIGARVLVADIPTPPVTLNFLVELDRSGVDDMVFYNCDNPDFESYIEKFGFENDWGTFSDISILAPAWGMAAVNLSIGYQDEHSERERLYYYAMMATIEKVKKILDAEAAEGHPFEYISGTLWTYSAWGDRKLDFEYSTETKTVCDGCEKVVPMTETTLIHEETIYWQLCPECVKTYARKCAKCGARFMDWGCGEKKCYDCRDTSVKVFKGKNKGKVIV